MPALSGHPVRPWPHARLVARWTPAQGGGDARGAGAPWVRSGRAVSLRGVGGLLVAVVVEAQVGAEATGDAILLIVFRHASAHRIGVAEPHGQDGRPLQRIARAAGHMPFALAEGGERDRKSVVWGKSVSVRVVLVGGLNNK